MNLVAKAVQPRLVANTSIPGLLSSLHSSWDDLMLETFQLKQSLDQTRQELAQALYQHDAACRVIARLMRERDEAYAQLQQMAIMPKPSESVPSSQAAGGATAMEIDHPPSRQQHGVDAAGPLPDDILTEMNEKCKVLSSARKSRKVSPSLTTKESIARFTTTNTLTPYPKSAKSGYIGCIALSSDALQGRVLVGGGEKDAMMLDRVSGKVLQKLSSHSKKINDLCFHPDASSNICFTASADRSVKIWTSNDDKYELSVSLIHPDEVSSIAIHPSGHYLLSGGNDGNWKLWNLASSLVRSIAYDGSNPSSLSTVSLLMLTLLFSLTILSNLISRFACIQMD
jgi:pre-mRNA-processing factor 19